MLEIKPCPYCGTTDFKNIFRVVLGGFLINHFCKFGVIKCFVAEETKEKAIEQWNNIIEKKSRKE